MKKEFLLLGIIFLIAFSGCLQQDITPTAKKLPEIEAVFQEYPNAIISAFFIRKDVTNLMLEEIRKDCDANFEPASYWNVIVVAEGRKWEFYVDESVTKVVCTIEPDAPKPKNECVNASECDDLDVTTKDECKGSPKKCVYTSITECINNDGYCPNGCVFDQDNDCPAINLCQSDLECIDSNRLTTDVCEGQPKRCVYSLKTCEDLGEDLCEIFEECLGTSLPTTDSGICCDTTCRKTTSCEGVVCEDEEKCVNGICVEKTCSERELPLCNTEERCTENYYIDGLGIKCCTGECRKPCFSNTDCGSGEICDEAENYCIAESCSDIGGKTCNAITERCTGEIERTVDNDNCCLECGPKKCYDMGGIFCDGETGESCTNATTTAFDGECCLDQCEVDPCFNIACGGINKKCSEGECVLKTCEEIGGINWELSETCQGYFYASDGILDCCVERSCEDMGGQKCLDETVCSNNTRLSTDVVECCTNTCIAE